MELLLKNNSNAGYELGDVIDIRPDGFEWSTGALDTSHFTIVKGVNLTQREMSLLKIPDEQLQLPKSALKNPRVRQSILKNRLIKTAKRRRYTFKNNVMEMK